MKNKIVIGVGLILSMSAGLSFAEDAPNAGVLPVSNEEVIKGSPVKINTDVLEYNQNAASYYNVTCTVNNIHDVDDILMVASMRSHGYKHNMGPVLLNGAEIGLVNNHVEASLIHGLNTIVFQNYYVEDNSKGSHILVEAKNGNKKTNPFGLGSGFYIQECHYAAVEKSAAPSV